MSGTPMENRVEEFRNLVHYIRPDVAATISVANGLVGADAFRRAVAPVYLRRNQVDVLDELPPKIESAEWLTLDGAALDAYKQAVAGGNFMAMRRAAFMTPDPADSPKLARLVEVHRLLTENSVDERMLMTLATKSELFAIYVRESALKDSTPEAVDVTGVRSVEKAVSQANQERAIIDLERQRLGLDVV